jgi:hypothetical protein
MNATKKVRKLPRMANPTKSGHFAIGVKPEHYWLITGIAGTKNVGRNQILENIIDHYIKTVFAKEGK